jgi:ferric-dicitrate binding protein FerR (iron transport regulator)
LKKSLINRFLTRKISSEELANLHEEVNRNEDVILKSIEDDWNAFKENDLAEWDEENWDKLQPLLKTDAEKKPLKVFTLQWSMKVAAALIVFISVWFIFDSQTSQTSDDEFPAMITKTNDTNRPSVVVLKDGTKVTLTANSSLSYYENFNKKYRVVHLNGEAFFETDKENKRPFIVVSDNITSICRGEEFSISAFEDNEEISVSLTSGEIEIAQNDKLNSEYNKVAVKGCQKYSFNKTSQKYLIGRINDCEDVGSGQRIKREKSHSDMVML